MEHLVTPPDARQPLVSVVVPAYNHEAYVEQAIRSVLDQTYPNIELVVVDDGSTDGTWGVVQAVHEATGGAFQIFTKPNGGVSSALNYGIARTSGSLISSLASDDYYLPAKTEEQVAEFVRLGEQATLVHVSAYEDLGDGRLIDVTGNYVPAEGACFEALLCDDVNVVAPCTMFRRSLYDAVGGFNESIVAEDVDFFTRVTWHGAALHYLPRLLMVKRATGHNLSRDIDGNYRSHTATLEIFKDRISPELYQRAHIRLFVSRGRHAAPWGDSRLAYRSYTAAARLARQPRFLIEGLRAVSRSIALGALPSGVRSWLREARSAVQSSHVTT